MSKRILFIPKTKKINQKTKITLIKEGVNINNLTKNDIIEQFIINENYQQENDIEIILYGSSVNTIKLSATSDIDLLIITKEPKNYKGVRYINNIRVEFQERSFYDLYDELTSDEELRNNSLISILKTGRTIYGTYLFSNELKDLINNKDKLSKKKSASTSIRS